MLKSLIVPAALGGVLLLAGCGADAEVAAKNLRSEIAAAQSSVASSDAVHEDQAGCLADGMVAELGVERLREYDVLTDDLKVDLGLENVQMSPADARAAAGVFLDCVSVQDLLQRHLSAGSTANAPTAEQLDCLGDTASEKTMERILVAGFEGRRSEAYDALRERMTECALTRS